jgi:hypothetical protein
VTPSATMRWTTLCGISLALVGVNVNVTMVEAWLLFTMIFYYDEKCCFFR